MANFRYFELLVKHFLFFYYTASRELKKLKLSTALYFFKYPVYSGLPACGGHP